MKYDRILQCNISGLFASVVQDNPSLSLNHKREVFPDRFDHRTPVLTELAVPGDCIEFSATEINASKSPAKSLSQVQ